MAGPHARAAGGEKQSRTLSHAAAHGALPDGVRWLEPADVEDEEKGLAVRDQVTVFLLSLRQGILKADARIAWCDEATEALSEWSDPASHDQRKGIR